MKYKKYPSYKDSGVEWLGEVPEHWEITRLGNISNITASGIDKKINEDEEKVKIINFTDIHKAKNFILDNAKEYMLVSTPLERKNKHQVKKGDLIFTPSSETIEDIGISALVNEELLNTSYSYHVLRCNFTTIVNHEYKKYLTNNTYCLAQFSSKARGTTRQTLSRDDFRTLYLSLPTIEEQQQIAKFLDNATQKIDTLIQKQENLIKLLKEKRQAVISHAVTRGLNPDVKFKDSGVEWLGDVPEHWILSKFAYLSVVVRGGSPRPAGDPTLFNGNYSPWVTVAEITKDIKPYLTKTKTFLTKKGSEQCRVFKKNTLLLSNSGATLGVPKILSINANANDGVVGFESLSFKLSIMYAYYYLFSLTENLRDRMNQGSGQPNLNTDIVKGLQIPLPPIDEQKKLVKFIDDKTQKIDKLIKKAKKSIKLLKEKRTALISAAVTGKIDVRELV